MRQNLPRKLYLGGFIILLCSLGYYQILKGDYFLDRAINNYVRVLPIHAIRGAILDRNSKKIAYDRPSYNIAIIPYQIRQKKELIFKEISQLTGLKLATINKNYKKEVTNQFSPVNIVEGISKRKALKLKESLGDEIIINPKPQRYYPFAESLAHVLGYVKDASSVYEKLKNYGYTPLERTGFSGIEQYYDSYLKGENGGHLIEINSSGKKVGYLGDLNATKGIDINLTIDYRIQRIAYELLNGNTGSLVMIDSSTGEIIAFASYPSYNPNYMVKGKNVGSILNNSSKPLLNRAIQSTYPIGSTIKPITATAILEEKIFTANSTIDCTGEFHLGRATWKCWRIHGPQNMYQALAHSCNSYFYNVGKRLGVDLIAKWTKAFGLGSLTKIDIPYEKKGTIPTPEWKRRALKQPWVAGDTINLSIGQGYIGITPISLLIAFNVFATDGFLVKPYFLKAVNGLDSGLTKRRYLGVSAKNLNIVKKGLETVVQDATGTARLLGFLNMEVAGKTGTAQARGQAHGWFVGYFPHSKPKYTICVMLENAGTGYEAVKLTHNFLKRLKEENLLSYD